MNKLIVAIFVILVVTGLYFGGRDANNSTGLVGTASASITAHNAEVEKVARETAQ